MEMAERLNSLHDYVTFLARSYGKTDPHFRQDLYQDAMEAVWKELLKAQEEGREVNDSFLQQKARWVMLSYVRTDKPKDRDRLAQLVEPGEGDWLIDRPITEDVSALYHRDEILAAISELSPAKREYIYWRFWRGYNKSELRGIGINLSHWYGSGKSAGAKAILAAKLAHLADTQTVSTP